MLHHDGPNRDAFQDRAEAGMRLAERLREFASRNDVLVLALPRGGVPVGFEVALALGAPLDVFVVRKLGVPGREELAMGAIASGGVRVLNDDVVQEFGIPPQAIDEAAHRELRELDRRESVYRGGRPRLDVRGMVVILVDDGLATGATMRAAIAALRRLEPVRIVAAVPVGAPDTCAAVVAEADGLVCLITPDPLVAVGVWYREFGQTADEEVRELLKRAR